MRPPTTRRWRGPVGAAPPSAGARRRRRGPLPPHRLPPARPVRPRRPGAQAPARPALLGRHRRDSRRGRAPGRLLRAAGGDGPLGAAGAARRTGSASRPSPAACPVHRHGLGPAGGQDRVRRRARRVYLLYRPGCRVWVAARTMKLVARCFDIIEGILKRLAPHHHRPPQLARRALPGTGAGLQAGRRVARQHRRAGLGGGHHGGPGHRRRGRPGGPRSVDPRHLPAAHRPRRARAHPEQLQRRQQLVLRADRAHQGTPREHRPGRSSRWSPTTTSSSTRWAASRPRSSRPRSTRRPR
jgi:hypothetical protein